MLKSINKELLTNILTNKQRNLLIFSQIISSVFGIFVGKLIAILFLPEQFGKFNLQFATYTFFISLFINPFIQFLKTFTGKDLAIIGHRYMIRILLMVYVLCSISLIIIFKTKFYTSNLVLLVILITLPVNILYFIFTDYFNIKGMLNIFSWSNILKAVSALLFLIAVALWMDAQKHAEILLWLVQLVGFLFGIIFFYKKYPWILKKINSPSFGEFNRSFLRFSVPVFILAFFTWITTNFDRYVIEHYLSTREVGIYNANLGLGSKIFIMIAPLFVAMVTPVVYNMQLVRSEKKNIMLKYSIVYFAGAFVVLSLLFFFYPYLGNLLLTKQYSEGFYLIFWTALAYFVITITALLELLFYAEGKTKTILLSYMFAAVSCVIVDLIFIPTFGLNGALFGLLGSSVLRLIYISLAFYKI